MRCVRSHATTQESGAGGCKPHVERRRVVAALSSIRFSSPRFQWHRLIERSEERNEMTPRPRVEERSVPVPVRCGPRARADARRVCMCRQGFSRRKVSIRVRSESYRAGSVVKVFSFS
jgi:hypothetical protein